MKSRHVLAVALILAGAVVASPGLLPARAGEGTAALEEELRAAETAFAKTMADRDHEAFTRFLSEEAIFDGPAGPLRGRAAVAEAWRPLFAGEKAPFSWRPETVTVLESGRLGLSSGPVLGLDGRRIGTFNSVWRRDEQGRWSVVFDRGCPPCAGP